MSTDSLMFRNVEMISEDSVNQVEVVPMSVMEVPIVVLEDSDIEEYISEEEYSEETMGLASYLKEMLDVEEEMEVTSINTVLPTLEPASLDATRALYLAVLDRNVHLRTQVEAQIEEITALYEAKESAEVDFESEHDEKVLMTDKAHSYKDEVLELKQKLVEKDQKIARMSYIHECAHEDFKLKIACYSIESGQTRHTISRDIVSILANQKYENAVRQC